MTDRQEKMLFWFLWGIGLGVASLIDHYVPLISVSLFLLVGTWYATRKEKK